MERISRQPAENAPGSPLYAEADRTESRIDGVPLRQATRLDIQSDITARGNCQRGPAW
jgi:hypothetical protein